MSKPLYITSVDAFRMYGNHNYMSGWDNQNNTRDWYFGTGSPNIKKMVLQNEKQEGIYLQSGSSATNTNLGQNKIVTNSNGISLRRGGISLNDTLYIAGEIGALGTGTDATFYINGNSNNNIVINSGIGIINTISYGLVFSRTIGINYVSGGVIGLIDTNSNTFFINSSLINDIVINSGSGNLSLNTSSAISLNSNVIWVGSGTAAGNGKYSNINMLDSGGQNWETQSSAFTETLKAQIGTSTANVTTLNEKFATASSFGGSKGKITLSRNFQIMGQTSLANGTTYNNSTAYNVGAQLQSQYPALFLSNGKYSGSEGDMNLSIYFEFGFLCKNSSMIIFKSYLSILDTDGALIDNSLTQGFHYNSGTTFNNILYFSIPPLKHIIKTGHQIILNTTYQFTTGTQGGYAMDGKFTIERNPL
jgi:hypothetical protein